MESVQVMAAHTNTRPTRKRSSPQPNDSSDNESTAISKRRRSHDAGDKENEGVQRQLLSPARRPASLARALTSPNVEHLIDEGLKPAEAGVIQKIYVENFMCHRKLTVDLCRNINFIYGQNGSGKSAILAAIQICLGAGARRTHRARNIKELVRKDAACACAKVRVTLLNRGIDGFQHDVYGDTITVERTIALRGGYNGYKLLNSNNQECSRSKKDLDEMLDKLNIQVENPVAILDQEEAKKFLTGKSEDKYAFFMKATELERIDRTYASTLDTVTDLDSQRARMDQNMQSDKDLVAETKRQYEQHREIEKLIAKKRGYEEGYVWASYKEKHATLEVQLEETDKKRAKLDKKKEELTQSELLSQGTDDEDIAKRKRLEELATEADEQSKLKHDLEKELKRAVEPQKSLERQLKFLNKDQNQGTENLGNANQRLQEKREEIVARAGSAESEEARRAQRLNEAEKKLVTKKELNNETKQVVSDALRTYEELEPHVDQAKQNFRAAKTRLNAVESRINDLQSSSSGNSLAMFGSRCTKVKQSVEKVLQQRRFKGPVLGPIGAYVKIVPGKEEFALIAEHAIGHGALDRFIVTNDHDRKIFQNIRRESGCQQDCGVFQIHQHSRYNIAGPPVQGIETVASVLNVSNDLVFNCLVDNCKIDERALSRSREESEKLLLVENSNGRLDIRGKVKNVFFLPKGDSWSLKVGSMCLFSNDRQLRQSIGVDKTAALAEAKRDAQSVQVDVDEFRKEESRLEHEHMKNQKAWNVERRELKVIQKDITQLMSEIDEIKAEDDTAANFDSDTSIEEQEVADAQQAVDELKERQALLKDQIEVNKPDIQDLKARVEEVKARSEKVLQDMKAAEDDLALYLQSLSQREEKLEKKRARVEQYNEIVEAQEEKIRAIKADAKVALQSARRLTYHRINREQRESQEVEGETGIDDSQIVEDPTDEELAEIEIQDTDKDTVYYQSRITRAEKKIDQEKVRRNASKEDITAAHQKYQRAQVQLDNKEKTMAEIETTIAHLTHDMRERKKRWRQFREHIAVCTDGRFDEILNRKGSSGQIEFDHQTHTLELVVQKDSADTNTQQKDVKALSGGERSYTTIALLLALGESLETPFRVLDEFDVFLDPITRKLTIDSLIKMAKALPHRQFIFITPQDVSNVEVDPNLKIIKMKNPNRKAVAGAPEQQTLEFSQS